MIFDLLFDIGVCLVVSYLESDGVGVESTFKDTWGEKLEVDVSEFVADFFDSVLVVVADFCCGDVDESFCVAGDAVSVVLKESCWVFGS